MIKKAALPALLMLIFLAGLFLPDAVLRIFDRKMEKSVFTLSCPANDYEYKGTFENLVSAFTAYENASVNVRLIEKSAPESLSALPWNLTGLLPDLGEGTLSVSAFSLTPAGDRKSVV